MTENDLRWQLRQLPREIDPPHDLWPGIAAGLQRRPAPRMHRWLGSFALAASVLLAAGLYWKTRGADPVVAMPTAVVAPAASPGSRASTAPKAQAPSSAMATVVITETRAITREYQAALSQLEGAPIAPPMHEGIAALDRSVRQIQRAIAADPNSPYLLQQLQKAYSRRLELTQRAIAS